MKDPRVEAYARLLVERCINVQAGWQVAVMSTPLARPLVEEVVRDIARRGAYALLRIDFATMLNAWVQEAPESILGEAAPIDRYAFEHMDAFIRVDAPENSRDGSDLSPERQTLLRQARRPVLERQLSFQMPWVTCQFPTPALAQDANMTLAAFEDFLYGACLLNWDEEGRKMRRIADRFDRADQVRIVAEGTDLTLSLHGRQAQVDDGHFNMPGGEVFYSPVETATEGVVTFSEFPTIWGGHEVAGVRMVYQGGRVVEASAERGEEVLIKTLDADSGARVLGELGIGCNPGVQQYMKNTLFDEKMAGTVHLAVGAGFSYLGSQNTSKIHWDMVKDLGHGGRIYGDGELVQENGKWVF